MKPQGGGKKMVLGAGRRVRKRVQRGEKKKNKK
jgi:hypothetical protein